MDPVVLAPAYAEIAKYGLLGAVCLILMAVTVWAMREKGKAEEALRESDRERISEAKEIGKLTAEISRTMATLAAALEASNRTAAEGNAFRQTIAQAVESLEKAISALAQTAADDNRELRKSVGDLKEAVLRSLPRGAA